MKISTWRYNAYVSWYAVLHCASRYYTKTKNPNKYCAPSVQAVVQRSWDICNWKSTGEGRRVCIEGPMGCVRWCKGKNERLWCCEGGYGRWAVRVLLETRCENFTGGIARNKVLRNTLQRRVADIYVGPFLIRFEQQLLLWTGCILVSSVAIPCSRFSAVIPSTLHNCGRCEPAVVS